MDLKVQDLCNDYKFKILAGEKLKRRILKLYSLKIK